MFLFHLSGVSVSCHFDFNTCGWLQNTNDDFDWTRIRGPTPSFDTGPLADHTTGGRRVETPTTECNGLKLSFTDCYNNVFASDNI